MKKNEKGFTMIELLVVVSIIGILASIALPNYSSSRKKGFNAAIVSDLRNVATAQEAYFVDHATYCDDLNTLRTALPYHILTSPLVTITIPAADGSSYTLVGTHPGSDTTFTFNGPGGTITH